MDIDRVCVSEDRLQALGVGQGEIKHGTYHYANLENPGKVKETR